MRPVKSTASHPAAGAARPLLALAIVSLALIVATAASLLVGSNRIPPAEVWGALFADAISPEATVIRTQRLPRTILGLAVGLALGAAGALMQGHTRNPLAEPGLFGVNAGAAFGVVMLTFAFGVDSALATVLAALVGAFAATAIVVAIAWSGRARGTPVTLALTGAALGALLASATTAVVLLDKQTLDVLRHWAVGSLAGRPPEAMPFILALIAVGLVLAVSNGPGVTALGLGDDVARSLGNRVAGIRIVGVLGITVLAAAATAACGPIAFLGLVAPYAVRGATGPRYTWLIPLAALVGAVLLLLADVVGRVAVPSGELPVGFVLAVVGAPVLIAIVARPKLVRL
ncbi:iron ABC transporter permease [Microbacterium sp. Root61]|uniref:FecCD family ABC transporter permease n=1 Tax=Microbacterium sp. Root61 TaxID=1736570 RepID=UPI0006F582E3|nr:iron ABC transporter permease [Microbacterium sp. Root61]KRA25326.1 iron ABC transporter permease [Microbacterium sp. Root61]